jgi:hypothetical protein
MQEQKAQDLEELVIECKRSLGKPEGNENQHFPEHQPEEHEIAPG